eukprot:546071-Alexandrium_andersonii.AAC.1
MLRRHVGRGREGWRHAHDARHPMQREGGSWPASSEGRAHIHVTGGANAAKRPGRQAQQPTRQQ